MQTEHTTPPTQDIPSAPTRTPIPTWVFPAITAAIAVAGAVAQILIGDCTFIQAVAVTAWFCLVATSLIAARSAYFHRSTAPSGKGYHYPPTAVLAAGLLALASGVLISPLVTPLLACNPPSLASPTPTQNAASSPSAEPTGTPTLTHTPTITPTPTPTPLPSYPGQDIDNGCIDIRFWKPYKATGMPQLNGCWSLETWGFTARPLGTPGPFGTPSPGQPGVLIAFDNVQSDQTLHAISFPLPGLTQRPDFDVSLNILIDALEAPSAIPNPSVFVGIGPQDAPGYLGRYSFFRVTTFSASTYFVVGSTIYEGADCNLGNHTFDDCKYDNRPQAITLKVRGMDLTVLANDVVIDTTRLSSRTAGVLWIGFRLPAQGKVRAFLWDLHMTE